MGTDIAGLWDAYFGEPTAPENGVNWDAYSHEELYQMLWQDADVADVSTVAAEWAEHRAALVNHAEVLRQQRIALLESWTGTGAEEAARRLDILADRVEKLAELAYAGERAAGQAADALARARAMMPPPPADPAGATAVETTPTATDWATFGAQFAELGRPSAATTASSASDMVGSFSAVGGATFSFYVGATTAETQKQQAVRAMQGYESSLTDSSRMLGRARDMIPAASTLPSTATTPASASDDTRRSWRTLVGDPAKGLTPGAVTGAVAGGALAAGAGRAVGTGSFTGMATPGTPLAPGLRVGSMALSGGPGATITQLAAETAATRPGAMGGMVPPGATGARPGSDDEEHENRMPTIDHGLFPLTEPGSEAVIGLNQGDDEL